MQGLQYRDSLSSTVAVPHLQHSALRQSCRIFSWEGDSGLSACSVICCVCCVPMLRKTRHRAGTR